VAQLIKVNPRLCRGTHFVSTVGLDENVVRAFIKEQGKEKERYEQLSLWK